MASQNLEVVLSFAARGWQCFPANHLGKKPATRHGLHDATTDSQQLNQWFGNGQLYNVAIRTGAASGFDVLDIDGDDGVKALQALIAVYGNLPKTPCVRTGGGGLHYYFRHADGVSNSASKIAEHLDVRGDGGYVIAPPSVHGSGAVYEWIVPPEACELADWPKWLLDRIRNAATRPATAEQPSEPSAPIIPAGQRNQTLTSIAGAMRRKGLDADTIEAALKTHNRKYCHPPLPDKEISNIARSMGRYAPSGRSTRTLPLVKMETIQPEPISWQWANRFPTKGINLIPGVGSAGKTTFAAYLMSVLTTGRDWVDCPNETPKGSCLFIGDEDDLASAIRPKLDSAGADCSKIFAMDYQQLFEQGDSFNLTEHIDRLDMTIEQMGDCRAVFFDPLNGYLGKINSYSDAEARSVLIPLQNIAKRHNISIYALCHLNKKSDSSAIDRVLGSVAFTNTSRSVWFVLWDKKNDIRYLTCEKANYSVNPTNLAFRIVDGAVSWLEGTTTQTADDILQAGIRIADSTDECIDWLREKLKYGSVLSNEINSEARHSGFTDHALRVAKRTLRVQSKKNGIGGKWMLSLPDSDK